MRKETIVITERLLMFVIGGQLFCQAPNRQPRKVEIIMQKVKDAFRKDAYNDNEYYSIRIPEADSYNYIKSLLKGIPEFEELNLSQIEFDKHITVEDENRPKYKLTSRYDIETYESWKHDFIDLDAFIRNVHIRLLNISDMEEDCFCCKHRNKKTDEPGDEICKVCLVNSSLKNYHECDRQPRGKYTFSCKYDCFEQKQICCEECDKVEKCPKKCDGNSKICGNKIERTSLRPVEV
jgi:hypothetical protein